MADYTAQTWVDDDGSATVGTVVTKARMDFIEAGVKDAAQDSKQRAALSSRPAAASGNKNWIWTDTDGGLWYSDGSNWRPVGAPRIVKLPVDIAMLINVNTASPGATLDGVTPTAGTTRVLLAGQTTQNQNGIWIWNGAAVAMTRALDAAVIANDIPNGTIVPVWQSTGTWSTAEFYLQNGSGGNQNWRLYKSPVLLHAFNSLPTNIGAAANGIEIAYQSTSFMTNGEVWRLKYNDNSGSAYKWEFVGGTPLFAEVVTNQSTTATGYAALATAGPNLTLPLGGDYDIDVYSDGNMNGGAVLSHSYDIGATGAVDADASSAIQGASFGFNPLSPHRRRKTGLTGGVVLTSKYKTSANTASFQNRRLIATPVRVG